MNFIFQFLCNQGSTRANKNIYRSLIKETIVLTTKVKRTLL